MSEEDIEKIFSELKKKVKPSKELTQRILAGLNVEKKNADILQEKGRVSIYQLILNQIHANMTKWKIVIPVVVVVLVIVGLVVAGTFKKTGQSTQETKNNAPTQENTETTEYVHVPAEVPVPAANGTVNDIIDSMTAFAQNEETVTVEEGNDASMVTIDSQAVSDFGQSYDENQF